MDKESVKLEKLIASFDTISRYSKDIYWMGTKDLKNCIFLNDAYEIIFRHPREPIFKDINILFNYLQKRNKEYYNPFIEMIERTKQHGPLAIYDETYQIVRGSDRRVRTIHDHGHPVYDKCGELLGFTGIARDMSSDLIRKQLPRKIFGLFPLSDRKKYYLKGKYEKIYLSPRQAECAFYLLQGKTAKQIAMLLQLSPRTVEEVLINIKRKLGLNYRSDIFDALIEGDFVETLID